MPDEDRRSEGSVVRGREDQVRQVPGEPHARVPEARVPLDVKRRTGLGITWADHPAPLAERSTARRRLRDEFARLRAVRDTLIGEGLAEETEAAGVAEMSTIDQHQADLGTETFERERDLSLLQDVEQEIADVRRAFVRLDRGIYGRCEACGTQIPDERLAALPAARFCLEHQAAAEVIPSFVT
jgi:RNA polymerase-binding transcription factor DksA